MSTKMVGIPATACDKVPLLSGSICLDHDWIRLVVRRRWPVFLRDIENVDTPPPHFFVVINAVEDDIPFVIFAMNIWTTEPLTHPQALVDVG